MAVSVWQVLSGGRLTSNWSASVKGIEKKTKQDMENWFNRFNWIGLELNHNAVWEVAIKYTKGIAIKSDHKYIKHLSHISATSQPHLSHISATSQPHLSHISNTIQPHSSHIYATPEQYLSHVSVVTFIYIETLNKLLHLKSLSPHRNAITF